MNKIFSAIFSRIIVRKIGQYTRYYFFRAVKSPKSLGKLSNNSNDDYKELENAIHQDILNTFVGVFVLLIIGVLLLQVL